MPATLFALLLQALPLPEKTDIPPTFSTVVCPDDESANTMLLRYYDVKPAPNNHITSTELFFEGLKATGCIQNGPLAETEITITSVIARKTVTLAGGPSNILAYRGTNAKGQAVVGVVDETENNRHPRTPLEEFQQRWAPDGYFDAAMPGSISSVFRCPSFADASAAVSAIRYEGTEKAKNKRFDAGRAKHGCTFIKTGRYTLANKGAERVIDCGFECASIWTAVDAKDESGAAVGLIFDTSEM